MPTPIITLNPTKESKKQHLIFGFLFYFGGLIVISIDYQEIARWIFGGIAICIGGFILYFWNMRYELHADKIIKKSAFSSMTFPINSTTIYFEEKEAEEDEYKLTNVLYVKNYQPSYKELRIVNSEFENYKAFKTEIKKHIKFQKSDIVIKSTQQDEQKLRQQENNIGAGCGGLLFLIGVGGLLKIIVLQENFIETVSFEPFLIVVGVFLAIYFLIIRE